MAAPSGTSWGPITYGNGYGARIGIYVTSSSTQTETKFTVQVWYWSQYSVGDTSNTFYYDWDSYAHTSLGSKSINTTSNSSWSTSNQVLIGTYEKTFTRTTAAQTKYFSARFTGIEYGGGTGANHYVALTVPARNRYSISYNANGGSGAPATQYYYYGYNTAVSSTIPTRTGYTFLGWSTSSSATSAAYLAGQTWSGTTASNTTLYAVWKLNSYTVTYNANGGIGAPEAQTKSYGTAITLSETVPIRKGYRFLGWGTSVDDTTVKYAPGSSYATNASITLYAVWKEEQLMYLNENGVLRKGKPYLNEKSGVPWININGSWRKGGS